MFKAILRNHNKELIKIILYLHSKPASHAFRFSHVIMKLDITTISELFLHT
jgi:hypothetical protein